MRINNNIMALNAHRQLVANQTSMARSMERLSSGLRINRAGDDAAGLAISEKMRGQIRGLKQAQRNAQDSISLIQTAEGALNETHSILQRIRELAVQAANDTNTQDDRAEIQKEVDQLLDEIDRIASTTEFNSKKLLNGNASGVGVVAGQDKVVAAYLDGDNAVTGQFKLNVTTAGQAQVYALGANATKAGGGAVQWSTSSIAVSTDFATAFGATAFGGDESITIQQSVNGVTKSVQIDVTGSMTIGEFIAQANEKLENAGMNVTVSYDDTSDNNGILFTSSKVGTANTITITANNFDNGADIGASDTTGAGQDAVDAVVELENAATGTKTASITVADDLVSIDNDSNTGLNGVRIELTQSALSNVANNIALLDVGKGGLMTQIGSNEGQEMAINIKNMSSSVLGVDSGVVGINNLGDLRNSGVMTQADASRAVTVIDKAIQQVSAERSKLGAYQNRLEHTISNLGTSAENLQAAESRIRDLDMAQEMMAFTKSNILNQAATAMLAQANAAPQSVLQLLG